MNISLINSLMNPSVSGLSPSGILTYFNTPIYTPRTDPITITSLSSVSIWGFNKTAAFCAALDFVVASGGMYGAVASNLLRILTSTGFSTSDPQVAAMVPSFVALGGGTITLDDANFAIAIPSYIAGSGITIDDINSAFAQINYTTQAQSLYSQADDEWNQANNLRNNQYNVINNIVNVNGILPSSLSGLVIN